MATLRRSVRPHLPDELWSIIQAQNGLSLAIRTTTAKLRTTTFTSFSTTPTRPSTPPSPSTIDPHELSHFSRLASSWWDPHGPSRLLHLMNPPRQRFIAACLSSSQSPRSALHYLDVGCGGGIFAEAAARLRGTASVTALDPNADVLAVARRHARHDPLLLRPGRLTYLCAAVEELRGAPECRGGGYDVVSVFEVLEHVASPAWFLEQCMAHVRPGGWLVLSTIARTWTSWVVTKVVAEDVLRMVPRGTHEWAKYVNEEELREWFGKKEGWSSPRIMGVMYVPGFGWKEVWGAEGLGNYFFGIRKDVNHES